MRCQFPVEFRGRSFPCNQCFSCQAFQRSEFVAQIKAEAALWGNDLCAFATLTIKPEYYPAPGDRAALRSLWRFALKRFPWSRRLLVPERGDRGGRVHAHLLVFGCSPLEVERYLVERWQGKYVGNMPEKIGRVDVKPFIDGTAGYLGRYVSKGQVARQVDHYRADGFGVLRPIYPRPGLGFGVVPRVAPTLESVSGRVHLDLFHDVPDSLSFNGSQRRMPRAIRRRLRQAVGLPSSSKERTKVQAEIEHFVASDPVASRVRAARDFASASQVHRDAGKLHQSKLYLDPGYRDAFAQLQSRIADGSFDSELAAKRLYRQEVRLYGRLRKGS